MEEADVGPWRPAPRADAPDPSAAVAEAPASAWREVDPENLLLVELAGGARVAIELAPGFAPVHVANIRRFARAGWWRDATVYRLQENYVAQWGVGESERPLPEGVVELPPAEYTRPLAGLDVRPLGNPDPYAPAAGFAEGWPVGYDPGGLRAWLAHCYGAVGVARGLAPDTGTGSELYAVIGHAPRHLDRNIALVGRVIGGIEALTSLPRGTGRLGFYEQEARRLPIERVVLAADLPPDERPSYEAMRTESDAFGDYLIGRANRGGEFFTVPAGGVDLCNVGVPVRVAR
ncbi:MAG: peptidylprolyl isomerase [Sphingomonadaceae bacterium]